MRFPGKSGCGTSSFKKLAPLTDPSLQNAGGGSPPGRAGSNLGMLTISALPPSSGHASLSPGLRPWTAFATRVVGRQCFVLDLAHGPVALHEAAARRTISLPHLEAVIWPDHF